MAWTYQCDRIDATVTVDSQKYGRATFYRYLYFKPSAYDTWSKTGNITSLNYSAELLSDSHIPAKGDHLSGTLSGFYAVHIEDISNLNKQVNAQPVSYAVVKILYQNTTAPSTDSNNNSNSSSNENGQREPWLQHVSDFVQTPYEINMPFKTAWNNVTQAFDIAVQNSAKQEFANLTTSIYGQKITWTFATLDGDVDYSHTKPYVNNNVVQIGDSKCTVNIGQGLWMPPSRKRLWWIDSKNQARSTPYYVWNFEVITNPLGHVCEVFDAGTKMIQPSLSGTASGVVDICTWYVDDPTVAAALTKHYGGPKEMIAARNYVKNTNASRPDNQKLTFTGDLINNPIPLNANGYPDLSAIAGLTQKRKLQFKKYQEIEVLSGNFGWR